MEINRKPNQENENIEVESDNKNRCGDLIIGSFDCVGDDDSV